MLVDSHSHIYLSQFNDDILDVLRSAKEIGVGKIILPNIDAESITDLLNTVTLDPDTCIPAMGLHPGSVREDYKEQLEVVFNELEKGFYKGVGEIGVDLYWPENRAFISEQKEAFAAQLDLALRMNLPVIIHARESYDEIFDVIDSFTIKPKGVFHCFSGDSVHAQKAIESGFYLGIGGVVTYKKSNLPSIVESIPLRKILLETDAPFLPPVPHRGKRNEPAYVALVAEKIAEIKGCSFKEVAEVTTSNALTLFNL